MNQDISLTLNSNITLRYLSSLNIAVRLWETPYIKKEIRKFGEKIRDKTIVAAYNDGRPWYEICEKVSDQLKDLELPAELICELQKFIPLIGDKILAWTVYVVKDLLFDVKYAQQIIWTQNGLINENKIYQDIWRTDAGFGGIPHRYNKIALYTIASIHADEKFLHRNLGDIAKVLPPYTTVKIKDVSKFKVNAAMTTLLIQYFASKSAFLNFKLLYSTLKSPDYPNGTDILFYYCAIYGFDKAAEYFYKKLKPDDRGRCVLLAAVECLKNTHTLRNFNYENERIPQIFLYLLNKMPNNIKKEFLIREIESVFTIFFFTWPYQNLCLKILDYLWKDLPLSFQSRLVQRAFDIVRTFSSRHKVYRFILRPALLYVLRRTSESHSDVNSLDGYFQESCNV